MGVVSCQKEKRLLVQEFVGAATDTGSAVFGVRHAPPVMTSSARVSSIVFMSPQGTASAGKNAPELSRRLYCVWTRGYQLPSNTQQYIVELLRVMYVCHRALHSVPDRKMHREHIVTVWRRNEDALAKKPFERCMLGSRQGRGWCCREGVHLPAIDLNLTNNTI